MSIKAIQRTVIGAVIFLVLLVGWFAITTTINQGHVGVVFSKTSGVQEETLSQGFKFVNPMHRITEYPVSTETVSGVVSVATKDGKPLDVEITYDYFNDIEKLPYIYNKFKGQKPKVIEDNWLKARLKDSTLSVTSKYTILQVFQEREAIRSEILQHFKEDVGSHGFIIENVVFGTPNPDKETKKAIQQVVDRQQELEALKIEKQKAQQIADKQFIESKGNADAKVEEARGTSEANAEISKSITPEILKLEELKARQKHGWIEINGTGGIIVDKK